LTVVIQLRLEERSCNRLIRFELLSVEPNLPHSTSFRIEAFLEDDCARVRLRARKMTTNIGVREFIGRLHLYVLKA
jgi:hypothetical protein